MYNLPSSQGERVCVGAHMNDHRVRETVCVEDLMYNLPLSQGSGVCGASYEQSSSWSGERSVWRFYEQSPVGSRNVYV